MDVLKCKLEGEDFMSKKRLSGILVVLMLLFIWGNSCLPGSQSSAVSGSLSYRLYQLLAVDLLDFDTFHHLIRKLAHFSEYACLGGLMFWYMGYRFKNAAWVSVGLCLMAAVIDEGIQFFVPFRSCQVTDVLIDLSGAVFLILCLWSIKKIRRYANHS